MSRSDRIRFCARQELAAAGRVTRWVEELADEVTVVRLRGALVARSSVCPHFGGPLEPNAATGRMRCAWHAWQFDLDTGECLTHSLGVRVRSYRAVERDDQVEIEGTDEDR